MSMSVESEEISSQPIQSDRFLRIAMSILPIMAVLAYQIDAIRQLHIHNMYAGLPSTILHLFYFLQFYTHFKCQSERMRLIYTYIYHLMIWLLKVVKN